MTEQMILDRMAQMIRLGFVNARMPEKMRVKVTLRDTPGGALVTDWLPVLCPRASGDMRYDLPDIGDQVLCLFLSYGLEQGFVVGSMYGRQVPPVQNADKWHRAFKDGTALEYDRAAHTLTAHVMGGCDVTATGSVTMKAQGPITLEAPVIYVRGTLVNTASDGSPGKSVFSGGVEVLSGGISVPGGDIIASGVSLVSHTTDGVEPGGGTSSHPTGGSPESPGTGPQDEDKLPSDQMALIEAGRLGDLRDRVEENGGATERTILCLPEIADAVAARKKQQGARADARGWEYLAGFFRKWLGGLPNEDAVKSSPALIDFDWVLDFPRARERFEAWASLAGAKETVLSPAGKEALFERICESGLLDPRQDVIPFDFIDSDFSAQENTYFNFLKIPRQEAWNLVSDGPDGLYTAMGNFTIRAFASGYVRKSGDSKWQVIIKRICVRVHDSFNFVSDTWAEKILDVTPSLGFWSCAEKNFSMTSRDSYEGLSNKDFRAFRYNYLRGKDFLVLSNMKCLALEEPLRYEAPCPK